MKKATVLVIALLCMASAGFAQATFTTSTIADANTRQSAATSNYGTSTYVAVEPGSQLRYGWFKFDTSGIKASFDAQYGAGNWDITSVSFIGQSWETWNYKLAGNFDFYYNSNGAWGETAINWNNQPAQGELVAGNWYYSAPGSPNPLAQTIALNTTASLTSAIKSGATFSIENHSNGGQVAWEAKEFNPSYAAQISVTGNAVPEPGALLALSTGLVGLFGFASRRRRH